MRLIRIIAVVFAFAALAPSIMYGQASTGTTTVSVTIGAEAALTVGGGGATNLSSVGTNFADYTGSTNLTYFIRTSASGGTGAITLKVTTDFACASGGPCVATPPSPGDALTYSCAVANPGNGGTATPCSGSQAASTTTTTPVGSFGADAHSLSSGNSGSVSWTLTNDPKYKTGTYSAVVTFTISAT
jgi:hypothetical protein